MHDKEIKLTIEAKLVQECFSFVVASHADADIKDWLWIILLSYLITSLGITFRCSIFSVIWDLKRVILLLLHLFVTIIKGLDTTPLLRRSTPAVFARTHSGSSVLWVWRGVILKCWNMTDPDKRSLVAIGGRRAAQAIRVRHRWCFDYNIWIILLLV